MKFFTKIFGTRNDQLIKKIKPLVNLINGLEPKFQKLSDIQLQEKTKEFRDRYEKGETLDKMFGYKNLQIKSIKLKDKSGSILELIDIKKPPKKKVDNLTINNGITHFAITIKDLDGFYKKYKNKIEFNCAPQISKDTKVKVLYAKTPEKCYVELVEEL